MSKLLVAEGLSLPLEAVTEKLAWLGRTGSGKTYGCKRFVEQMLHAGAQVVVVDTMGMWAGLRLGPKAFKIHVFGGLHGDLPLEPTSGELIADVIVDHGISVVLDVSMMTDPERCRFMTAFGRRLFMRKRSSKSAMHIVLDEGQDIVPQNPSDGEQVMLHEWHRICKQGRGLGIGVSIVTQRPQEVNKKALNQVECVFAFQLTGPQERKALAYWLSDKKSGDEKLDEILPRLERGAPHVWSPSWLKVSKVAKILPIESLDTSQTPKVGQKAFQEKKLAPIDLGALKDAMASTIEKSKAEDPKALRAQIAELQKQLKAKPAVVAAEPVVKRVEVPMVDLGLINGLRDSVMKKVRNFGRNTERACKLVTEALAEVDRLAESLTETNRQIEVEFNDACGRAMKRLDDHIDDPLRSLRPRPRQEHASSTNGGDSKLPKIERLILTAMAQQHPTQLTRERLALIVGYHANSKGFSNGLGALRGRGAVEGMTITEGGFAELGEYEELPTGPALLDWWCQTKLTPKQGQIARLIQESGPGLTRDGLAGALGCHPNSKGFSNDLGRLRGLGIVEGLQLSENMR